MAVRQYLKTLSAPIQAYSRVIYSSLKYDHQKLVLDKRLNHVAMPRGKVQKDAFALAAGDAPLDLGNTGEPLVP